MARVKRTPARAPDAGAEQEAAPDASHLNPSLAPLAVPLDSLRLDERNARKHGRRNMDALKASLREHGQQKPIVVAPDGTAVAAGNATLMAARELGWPSLAAVVYSGDPAKCRAFAIADNRSAELAEWNLPNLSAEIADLRELPDFDLADIGFTQADLDALAAEGGREDDHPHGSPSIKVTAEERETIDRAIAHARKQAGDPGMSEGRALELICADWMAGQ